MELRWRLAQFFEKLWWRRYLSGRDWGAYLDWKCRYWLGFLEKGGISLPVGAKVLDAGCGPAGVFTVLSAQNRVDALDPLLDVYEKTLGGFRRADWPSVRFFNQKLEDFEPGHRYDAVFCLNAVNHVDDLPAALDRLAALVEPGGMLAVSVDAHRSGFLKKIFRLVPGDILHPHQHGLDDYRAMLLSRGLSVEREVLVKREAVFDYFLIVCSKSTEYQPLELFYEKALPWPLLASQPTTLRTEVVGWDANNGHVPPLRRASRFSKNNHGPDPPNGSAAPRRRHRRRPDAI